MLKTRIITAIALAAGLSLGATGCGFFVPQATLMEYAPGDGINADLPNADVRNLFVVAGDDSANIVFTGVNHSEEATRVSIKLVQDGNQVGQRNFTLDPGSTIFGVDPHEIIPVSLDSGTIVDAYIEGDGTEVQHPVPVLGGDLAEYADLVPGK